MAQARHLRVRRVDQAHEGLARRRYGDVDRPKTWIGALGAPGGEHEAGRAPVRIGDRTYVGSQAVVLKGVTIGDHCVLGARGRVVIDEASGAIELRRDAY